MATTINKRVSQDEALDEERKAKRHSNAAEAGKGRSVSLTYLPKVVLHAIFELLPDPESVCRLGTASTLLKQVLDDSNARLWDAFLMKIPDRARPKQGEGEQERTSREIVLRFASARIFAKRMEVLAPRHRVMLGEGKYCSGCDAFPDADGYWDENNYPEHQRSDVYFTRYSVQGLVLWQGFLKSYMCSNGDIYLGNDSTDLSEELNWPEMKAFLVHHAPCNAFGLPNRENSTFLQEKERMLKEMYKKLTLTIVLVNLDDLGVRKLCVSVSGNDEDDLDPDGYCRRPHMEIMPKLSHGVQPVEPMEEPYVFHPYYRTTKEWIHYSGEYVAVGHNYRSGGYSQDRRSYLPDRYVGPVFGGFEPRSD